MKTLTNLAFLLLVSFGLLTQQAYAKHIVGGEITYKCLGNGNYRFTLKIWRDCLCTDCANFDNPAHIGIYRENTLIKKLSVNLVSITPVNPPNDPCMTIPNVCVQEGLYVFEEQLPTVNQTYTIVYQRCCRNETITNIIAPDASGATFSVDISPLAQQICNNSPTFNSFPPIIICGGFPLIFDHSATDSDGHQLVYEFCAPLLGGGVDGGPDNPIGDPNSCTGVTPNPPCAPPYLPVNFVVPTYTFAQPMAGSPVVSINANTGLITGTPTIFGQFVVGVCVSEYNASGQFIGKIRRDFQFNVTTCQPTVLTDLVSDSVSLGPTFYYKLCGDSSLYIQNKSLTLNNIQSFRWEFVLGGSTQLVLEGTGNVNANNWNPTINLPGYGQYTGLIILNPGLLCNDTGYVYINAFPGIESDFSYTYDTCVAGPVNFSNLSVASQSTIVSSNWSFGDGQTSNATNPAHLFAYPGEFDVSLSISDNNGCASTKKKTITWLPAPEYIIVAPSEVNGCTPVSILLNNLSYPVDSTYDVYWEFNNGVTSQDISPLLVFSEPGVYSAYVSITSPIGCTVDTTFTNLLNVREGPVAFFLYEPGNISSFNKKVDFIDLSVGANQWFWKFDTLNVSYKQNPTFVFPDTGLYAVTLIVTHPNGCKDTLIRYLDVVPEVTYFLPTAFSPNEDGLHEFFLGRGYFDGMRNFNMKIFNRWGEMVFETEDPNDGWNGTLYDKGDVLCENGVYVVVVTYTTPRGEDRLLKQFVTLIR